MSSSDLRCWETPDWWQAQLALLAKEGSAPDPVLAAIQRYSARANAAQSPSQELLSRPGVPDDWLQVPLSEREVRRALTAFAKAVQGHPSAQVAAWAQALVARMLFLEAPPAHLHAAWGALPGVPPLCNEAAWNPPEEENLVQIFDGKDYRRAWRQAMNNRAPCERAEAALRVLVRAEQLWSLFMGVGTGKPSARANAQAKRFEYLFQSIQRDGTPEQLAQAQTLLGAWVQWFSDPRKALTGALGKTHRLAEKPIVMARWRDVQRNCLGAPSRIWDPDPLAALLERLPAGDIQQFANAWSRAAQALSNAAPVWQTLARRLLADPDQHDPYAPDVRDAVFRESTQAFAEAVSYSAAWSDPEQWWESLPPVQAWSLVLHDWIQARVLENNLDTGALYDPDVSRWLELEPGTNRTTPAQRARVHERVAHRDALLAKRLRAHPDAIEAVQLKLYRLLESQGRLAPNLQERCMAAWSQLRLDAQLEQALPEAPVAARPRL